MSNTGMCITHPLSGEISDNLNNCNPMTGVTLQISNLDTTIEENELKKYLINRLKPIATVISIYFETLSVAKIKLPTDHQARQVITYLHRKKIGHKRITVSNFILNLIFDSFTKTTFWEKKVSYTREPSTLDSSTIRCQVAGLLKESFYMLKYMWNYI